MTWLRASIAVVIVTGSLLAPSASKADVGCDSNVAGAGSNGAISASATEDCRPLSEGALSDSPTTKTIDCGPRNGVGVDASPSDPCAGAGTCVGQTGGWGAGKTTIIVTLTQQPDGSWLQSTVDCNVPVAKGGGAPAGPGPSDVRQQIERLVPRPGIGVAPPGGVTLVNIQTLLWIGTTATRDLGTVTLLGRRVDLQVTVTSVRWDFGDGAVDTTTSPGRPYDPADPCSTALCPDYFGHTYTTTGPMTITATTTWTGRYRIDGGAWQTIATPVTGPPEQAGVTVKQTRAVLVPTPQ